MPYLAHAGIHSSPNAIRIEENFEENVVFLEGEATSVGRVLAGVISPVIGALPDLKELVMIQSEYHFNV